MPKMQPDVKVAPLDQKRAERQAAQERPKKAAPATKGKK